MIIEAACARLMWATGVKRLDFCREPTPPSTRVRYGYQADPHCLQAIKTGFPLGLRAQEQQQPVYFAQPVVEHVRGQLPQQVQSR